MIRKEIGENVYLTFVPSEKFKTSFWSAQIAVPLRRETAGLNALMVNVLSRGTARCPDMAAIGRELDMLYGARLEPSVRKMGETQLFGFVASCVDDRLLPEGARLLEKAADLLGEFLCDPAVDGGRLREDYVDSERANLADLIRSEINDKRSYAARRLIEEMCARENYGVSRLGSAGEVERISAEELDRHYRSVLRQGRLELFYCGPAEEGRVSEAFARALAALPRQGRLELTPTVRRPAPRQYRTVTEELDVTQGKLCMGYRVGSGDVPANMLMNALLGGVSTSKLFTHVRERLSLCYYAGSSYHRVKGLITVSSGIESADYDRAVEAIGAQLAAMKSGQWEDWELEAARQSLLNTLRATEDSAGALENYSMGQAVVNGVQSLEELEAAVRSLTPDSVRAAAETVELDTIYFLRGREARP